MLKRKLEPLDWNFSGCPEKELRYLYCYEFSRELPWISTAVDAIRRSESKPKIGWTDWPEWPRRPYLSVPQAERQKRLETLLKRGDEDTVLAWRVTPLIGKQRRPARWLSAHFYLQKDQDPEELASALRAYIYLHLAYSELLEQPRSGRATGPAAYKARLQKLSVYRLRSKHSAAKTLEVLEGAIQKGLYSDESALERAKRSAKNSVEEFSEMAGRRIESGFWFPPFGRFFITF